MAFDVGLAVTLVGVLSASWIARDFIAFALEPWLGFSGQGGIGGMSMNLFVLAVLVAMVGLAIAVVGVVRVRRSA